VLDAPVTEASSSSSSSSILVLVLEDGKQHKRG
jgi:hypothetical protein